jgi:hypothetical protein
MANNIAAEMPVNNAGLWWCEITESRVNVTTGDIEEVPVTGRTDVVAFVAATKELSSAAAIHADLQLTLTNASGTNRYYAYPQGDKLTARLLPTYLDQKVYVHFEMGNGEWHEVAETTVVDTRAAVA